MFGSAFLVSPVTEPKATARKVYLPQGTSWYDFWTGLKSDGGREVDVPTPLGQVPLAVRAGSILPLGPVVQYAGEKPADPIELRVFTGQDGHLDLYEDEGDGYRYEQGVHAVIPLNWDQKAGTLTLGDRQGTFPGMLQKRTFHIVRVKAGHGIGLGETKNPDSIRWFQADGALEIMFLPPAAQITDSAANSIQIDEPVKNYRLCDNF
jgi:alpha-D-xyloside xylohydrolase